MFPAKSGTCHPCDSTCSTCSGAGNSACLSCKSESSLSNGACVCSSSGKYQAWNGLCRDTCPFNKAPIVLASGQKFCEFPCSSSEYLSWSEKCMATCKSPLISRVEGGFNYCSLPCKNQNDFYYPDLNTCSDKCNSPYTIQDTQLCVTPSADANDYLTKMNSPALKNLLTAPTEPGTVTIVVPYKLMQYIRFLNIPMPSRLDNFANSQGRSPLSIKIGFTMPSKLIPDFKHRVLSSTFSGHTNHSSFLVNYFEILASIIIGLFAGLLLNFSLRLCRRFKSEPLSTSIISRLEAIVRWNFSLMILAYNIDDLILFTAS